MSDIGTPNISTSQVTKDGNGYFVAYLIVFFVAGLLRVLLSLVNQQANDNHYEVVRLILQGRTGLTMENCRECFHPKFFYYLCAAWFRALDLVNRPSQIVAGQLLNTVAGSATLLLVFLALRESQSQAKYRFWIFVMIALNPRLIAINGQLSNDSFAILFATSAIFLTLSLLKSPSLWCATIAQLALSCALMSKGTTWVVAIAMFIVFFLRGQLDESSRRRLFFVLLSVVTALNGALSIRSSGYDFSRYDTYAYLGRGKPLHFFEKNTVGRPGVQSVVDGYLTFRIHSLLSDPQITNGSSIKQQHRTSVWTLLYAQANFAQFEQHPKSWLTVDPSLLFVAKCSMALGLLPLSFFLIGLGSELLRSMKAWRNWGVPLSNYSAFFCLMVSLGYIAFIIKFTADYRDFCAAKLIYILPGILPFTLLILQGREFVAVTLSHIKIAERAIDVALGCLVVLHFWGIVALVNHLARIP
jgi:hypothetical protein